MMQLPAILNVELLDLSTGMSPPLSESAEREKRLKKISGTIGAGLHEEFKRNKDSLRSSLSQDFIREITLAEARVSHEDSQGVLYHGFKADMIHRTLDDMEE
ncbi:MAG: hypothetical protein ACRD8Z_03175 [Nitrososphaeraceae archaeon]